MKTEPLFKRQIPSFWEKIFSYLKAHWKWIAFALGCILFLYVVYFIFCFKTAPTYSSADQSYWNVRVILFRVFCGALDVAILFGACGFMPKEDSMQVTLVCYWL